MVECTALEMRHTGNRIGGSNPSLSAKTLDVVLVSRCVPSHHLDPRPMAGRSRETSVASEQRSIERFGEGDVDGVVGSEILPQIPNTGQKEFVRIAAQGKIGEIGESHAPTLAVDLAICGIATEHLRDFQIEQIRRVQRLRGVEEPPFHCFRVRPTQESFEERRRVNDDHYRHVPRGPLVPVPSSG